MRKSLIVIFITILSLFLNTACSKETQNPSLKQTPKKLVIWGKWVSENGTLYDFSEDGQYGWYKDKADTTDNYYKGPLEVLAGEPAMADLGLTEEEFERAYKAYTNKDDIYSVKMHFETLNSEGIDKSASLNKEDYYYYMFMISSKNQNEGIAVNISNPEPIKVTRMKEQK